MTVLAVFVALIAVLALAAPAHADHDFQDVPSSSVHHDNVENLVEWGVTNGCAPNKFCPALAVRRDQFATFLTRYDTRVNGLVGIVNDRVDDLEAAVEEAAEPDVITSHKPGAQVITLAAGEKGTAVAGCPEGQVAAGGGYEVEGANASAAWLVERNQPGDPALPQQGFDGANFPAWHVVVRNTGTDTFTVQPAVVCEEAPAG